MRSFHHNHIPRQDLPAQDPPWVVRIHIPASCEGDRAVEEEPAHGELQTSLQPVEPERVKVEKIIKVHQLTRFPIIS